MDKIRCFSGPKLYHIYPDGNEGGKNYEQNQLEKLGDSVIKSVKILSRIFRWTLPFSLPLMYYKGMFTIIGIQQLGKFSIVVCISYLVGIFMRGLGRILNNDYSKFNSYLSKSLESESAKQSLFLYDCDTWVLPTGYSYKNKSSKVRERSITLEIHPEYSLIERLLGFLAIVSFGRTLTYPGATKLLQTIAGPMITQGRTKLIEEKGGKRAMIETLDGNRIDTVFVDRRRSPEHANGSTLVICCEGNAGFYEIGCSVTPLDAGFSVLGWNHPGFWGSTGSPTPGEETNAIDAVFAYAIDKLNFKENDICLFGWSIGGYSASYAVARHPDVKYVILDATFDDILPLAEARMPKAWKKLVKVAIRKYMNVRVDENLMQYQGPITLIRRARDEMITTSGPVHIWSNRGNELLMKILAHRYPNIITESVKATMFQYLGADEHQRQSMLRMVEEDDCWALLKSYCEEKKDYSFPCTYGEECNDEKRISIALYLASKYMRDFDSSHCTPLPDAFFQEPWMIKEG